MGVLKDNCEELIKSVNNLAEEILSKSSEFLVIYDETLPTLYRDAKVLKEKMKEKIERGIRNYDSE